MDMGSVPKTAKKPG